MLCSCSKHRSRAILENKITESNKLISKLAEDMKSFNHPMNQKPDATHTSDFLIEMNERYWTAALQHLR